MRRTTSRSASAEIVRAHPRHRGRRLGAEEAEVALDVDVHLRARVRAEREPAAGDEPRRLPALFAPGRARDLERGADLRRIGREAEAAEAVGVARRAPDRAGDQRSGENLRATGLHRRGPDRRDAVDHALARPRPAHQRHLLLHARETPRERRARRPVVLLAPADADADRDPAAREHVHRRELLRHQQRAVQRARRPA